MEFDVNGIMDSAQPIRAACSSLSAAKSTIASISIPDDFAAGGTLRSIPSQIQEIYNALLSSSAGLNEIANKLKSAESNSMAALGNLSSNIAGLGGSIGATLGQAGGIMKSTGASVVNTAMSIVKGTVALGETAVDIGAILGVGISMPFTQIYDNITRKKAEKDGTLSDWKSLTDENWKNTCAFISEEHVSNAFYNFYNNSELGRFLDENAYEPFKSDSDLMYGLTKCSYYAGLAGLAAAGAIVAIPALATSIGGVIAGGLGFGAAITGIGLTGKVLNEIGDKRPSYETQRRGEAELAKLDTSFLNSERNGGSYGANQGALEILDSKGYKGITEYWNCIDELAEKYNASASTISIAASMDSLSGGVCTYSDLLNALVNKYKDNPAEFEKKFGFPLYKETGNGKAINQEEVLLDMFIWSNSKENGGSIFERGSDGKLAIADGGNTSLTEKVYMNDIDTENKYLNTHDTHVKQNETIINTSKEKLSQQEIENLKEKIKAANAEGKTASISRISNYVDDPISYENLETGEIHSFTAQYNNNTGKVESAGHITTITGVNDDGMIVDSWGEKYLIKWDDLTGGTEQDYLLLRDIS